MNLAFLVSSIWKRVHPQAASGRASHFITRYAEVPLDATFAVFVLASLSLAFFVLLTPVTCHPVGASTFAWANSGTENYYGMRFVGSVCETELKTKASDGYSVLAILLVLLGCALLGVNHAALGKWNRAHAISRGDLTSSVLGDTPPASWETPEHFRRTTFVVLTYKLLHSLCCIAAFVYFLTKVELQHATRSPEGVLSGGSLLTRYGAVCNGTSIRFEDTFNGAYRCHLLREPVLTYLKALVWITGSVFCIVTLAMLATFSAAWLEYTSWTKAEAKAASARARAAEMSKVETGVSEPPDAGWEKELSDENASLVRALKVSVKLVMAYMRSEPDPGLPELMAKIIVGKPPRKEELARMVGSLLALKEPPSEEIVEVLHAVMVASLGAGLGRGEAIKQLLQLCCVIWTDSERQNMLRGMMAVLQQQELARAQRGPVNEEEAPVQAPSLLPAT
jgi:hypothetical protein